MEIKKLLSTISRETVGYKCNRCGRRIYKTDVMELQEFHHIDFVGGYGSVFGDGERIRCDLCQHCLKDLIFPFYEREEE